MRQQNRRMTTKKGVMRRLLDVGLEHLTDHRQRRGRRYRHRASYRAQKNGRHRPIPYPARGGRTRSDSDRLRQAKPTVAKREVLRCFRGRRRPRIEH